MSDPAERFFHAPWAGETFEAAIARANGWLLSVLDSSAGKAFAAEWGKNFDGLSASPPVAVKVIGPPAPLSEIAMLEGWLGARLPPSYRRFLNTLGQVEFLHRPSHPTHPVGAIKAETEGYREMMDEWFEGYEDDEFAQGTASTAGAVRGYRSWPKWPNGSGVVLPEEVKNRNLVPIYPGYERDAHLLALHLAYPSGETPVFQNYPDDGAAFALRGDTFDAWMSSVVDELILQATPAR
jgi:hypothetical protein